MPQKKIVLIIILALLITSCTANKDLPQTEKANVEQPKLSITKYPKKEDYNRSKLKSLPSYDQDSKEYWQMDLRSYDLSHLDLNEKYDDLIYADFDSKTIWPQQLPNEFKPEKIMELGKNPGLGIRELHMDDIDGKGIGIAIIDQSLLVNHVEYKENLKLYEEINWKTNQASMHGGAVASIAVGKTVGVAPKADLYYIANWFMEDDGTLNFSYIAQAIDRILEVNEGLPKENRIRVISIARGFQLKDKGYNEVMDAISRAKEQDIFVISSSLNDTHDLFFSGLGRDVFDNPDEVTSYKPGLFWQDTYYSNEYSSFMKQRFNKDLDQILLAPMDSRSTASPTGNDDYVFYRTGGWSWSIPYIAGVYTLACQVKPDITPEIFWKKALETGDTIPIERNNKTYKLGRIINPIKLIESLKE